MSTKTDTTYDIVVFGATSFVGQILTSYLFETYGIGKDVRWAIAGRSESKLSTLKQSLGKGAGELPMIVADAGDESALKAMCDQTRVVISTVGPYALYGEPLVKICAETGTDYCDLTGEVSGFARWWKPMRKPPRLPVPVSSTAVALTPSRQTWVCGSCRSRRKQPLARPARMFACG